MGWSPAKFDHRFLWVLLINKAPHIKKAEINNRKTFPCTSVSTEVAASTEYLGMNQPLTIDVQITKLADFIVDSDIRKVGQAGVRTTGGGFLVNKGKKTDSLLCFIPFNLCIYPLTSLHEFLWSWCFTNYANYASLKPCLKAALSHIFPVDMNRCCL